MGELRRGGGDVVKRKPNIIEAIKNPKLFGSLPRFKNLESWASWLVVLKTIFGIITASNKNSFIKTHLLITTEDRLSSLYIAPAEIWSQATGSLRVRITRKKQSNACAKTRSMVGIPKSVTDQESLLC